MGEKEKREIKELIKEREAKLTVEALEEIKGIIEDCKKSYDNFSVSDCIEIIEGEIKKLRKG